MNSQFKPLKLADKKIEAHNIKCGEALDRLTQARATVELRRHALTSATVRGHRKAAEMLDRALRAEVAAQTAYTKQREEGHSLIDSGSQRIVVDVSQ